MDISGQEKSALMHLRCMHTYDGIHTDYNTLKNQGPWISSVPWCPLDPIKHHGHTLMSYMDHMITML